MAVKLSEIQTAAKRPSVDCHFHIIDHARFPFSGTCGYTPRAEESGTFEELSECMQTHAITHGLAVQPSGYGFDNSALLDALQRARGRLKGIAVVPVDADMADLHRLAEAGVVGIRFNLTDFDPAGLAQKGVQRLLDAVGKLNWFAEVQCSASDFPSVARLAAETGVRLLIDHLGGPDPSQGMEQPGFGAILGMAQAGQAVVKLSGAFRKSCMAYPHEDLDPFARALIDAYTPGNCVWGSDWPFINCGARPDYRQTLSVLKRWVADEQDRRTILWETPARLFGFKEQDDDGKG
jgi:predicted TIM-barrel fold metal-dependent hydrolase